MINQVSTIIGCEKNSIVQSLHDEVLKYEESKLINDEYKSL